MVYIYTTMSIPKDILMETNALFFSFIWKGKDKIKRNVTFSDFEHGGMKMLDFETFIMSLRLSWLKRLFDENEIWWKEYVMYRLKSVGGIFFFKCNYDISKFNFSLDTFYKELMQSWSKFRQHFDIKRQDELILWNNQDITIGGKSVFYNDLYSQGIISIYDLYHDLNNMESFEIVKGICNSRILNILNWSALRLQASKKRNETQITEIDKEVKLICHMEKGTLDVMKAKTKRFYAELIKLKQEFPTKAKKLKEDFLINDDQLKLVYSLPHKICMETYVKNFQHRILNYIVYTNDWLHKFGMTDSPLCSFCKEEVETIYHLFYYCIHVRSFWDQFDNFWSKVSKMKKNKFF